MIYSQALNRVGLILLLLVISVWHTSAFAQLDADADQPLVGSEAPVTENSAVDISDLVQGLKRDVVNLNRDLFILEEELLFPANSQVAVYLSMDVGEFFQLDAVHLKIDEQEVTDYLYTEKEVDALFRGGIQRLFLGNVRNGEHELTAFFTGRGPKGRDYRRAVTQKFVKGSDVKHLELQIRDSMTYHQPDLSVKEWR